MSSNQLNSGQAPDQSQAKRFLDTLDPEGIFTFQTFADRDELNQQSVSRDGKGRTFDPLAKVFHGTLQEHAGALISLNEQGAGVFVMINEGDGVVHEGRRTCRTNGNVIRVRANFVDLDGAPLEPVLNCPHPPTIVVESSPARWHAYWLTDCELEGFGRAQTALADKFGGDKSVTDLARVMRLPGFIHNKSAEPVMTRLLRPGYAETDK